MYLTIWQPLLECIFRQIYLHITSWLNGIYLLEESINFLKTNISSSSLQSPLSSSGTTGP